MIGHTGSFPATIKAVEAVDSSVARMLNVVARNGYTAFVTADHGNAEQMWDYVSNCPHTQHTLNDVYFIVVSERAVPPLRERGRLADIAPTILDWMELQAPAEMTGTTLFVR